MDTYHGNGNDLGIPNSIRILVLAPRPTPDPNKFLINEIVVERGDHRRSIVDFSSIDQTDRRGGKKEGGKENRDCYKAEEFRSWTLSFRE